MSTKHIIKEVRGFLKPFRVTDGNGFRLEAFDPGETLDLDSEDKPQMLSAFTGRNIAGVWEQVARSPHSIANSPVSGCVISIDQKPCLG